MAYQDTHFSDLPQPLFGKIKSIFAAVGTALVSASTVNRRMQLVDQLNGKSDAELAEIGIQREDILRYVFRDMLVF
ncbi:MAG: DUF1127 domain-containing protein [Roseobacter sp.]